MADNSEKTPSGRLLSSLLPKSRLLMEDKPEKMSAGRLLSVFFAKESERNADNPSKSPAFSAVMLWSLRLRLVIKARCAAVTSLAESTPGTSATILSWTCCVRSLTGVNSAPLSCACTLPVPCIPYINNIAVTIDSTVFRFTVSVFMITPFRRFFDSIVKPIINWALSNSLNANLPITGIQTGNPN